MSTEGNCTRKKFLLADSRTKDVIYGLFTTRVYVHAFPSLCERTHTFKARGDGPLNFVSRVKQASSWTGLSRWTNRWLIVNIERTRVLIYIIVFFYFVEKTFVAS